ncbi:uncharacterized protein ACN2A1_006393 isoform 1-T2 [Glossina fuscipes fuscipes]
MFKNLKFFIFLLIFFINLISSLANAKFAEGLLNWTASITQLRRGNVFRNFPTKEPCFVVSLVWYSASEENQIHHQLGGILSERIIITTWAPDFSHERESMGYCVLGFNLTHDGNEFIPWRIAVSADEGPVIMEKKGDGKHFFKITLIWLEKPIILNTYIGGYNFTALPPVDQSVEKGYTTLPKDITDLWNRTERNEGCVPFLEKNVLRYARITVIDPNGSYKNLYGTGPVKQEAPFLPFALPVSRLEEPRCRLCEHLRGGEGSPIIHKGEFYGLYFHQLIRKICCESKEYHVLAASRVNFYAKWINHVKAMLENDGKKVRYSRLSPFVMFYGNESSGEVMGLLTFLGEKFAITHHLDENNVKALQVLPGIKKLDSGFVGEKRIAIKKVTNSVPGETQLALVELVSEINDGHQFEINLPTTLYPIYGSKCEIMTILNKNTNSDEITSRNNFVFGSDTKILHEVRIIRWNYRECKRYIRGLKENQFCLRFSLSPLIYLF